MIAGIKHTITTSLTQANLFLSRPSAGNPMVRGLETVDRWGFTVVHVAAAGLQKTTGMRAATVAKALCLMPWRPAAAFSNQPVLSPAHAFSNLLHVSGIAFCAIHTSPSMDQSEKLFLFFIAMNLAMKVSRYFEGSQNMTDQASKTQHAQ